MKNKTEKILKPRFDRIQINKIMRSEKGQYNVESVEKLKKKFENKQNKKYKAQIKQSQNNKLKQNEKNSDMSRKRRLKVCIILVIVLAILFIMRIAWIQFIDGDKLKQMALEQQSLDREINPRRGTIYDATGKNVLAISSTVNTITVNPNNISKENKEKVAEALSNIFELDYEKVLKKVKKNSSIENIAKRVDKEKADELRIWMTDNNIEIGIIIPEKALINKIQVPIILFLIVFIAISVILVIILAVHYIRIIEELKRNHMNIKKIIEEGENTNVEFKSSLRYDSNTEKINKALEEVIMKSIAAFSNTEGGRLFIGISNDGEILGLEHDYSTLKHANRDFFELHLRTLIETYYGNAFSAEGIRIDFVTEDEKDICIVYISKGKEPVYTKITNKQGAKEEKFYIRVGNSSREIANASEIIAYVKKHFK